MSIPALNPYWEIAIPVPSLCILLFIGGNKPAASSVSFLSLFLLYEYTCSKPWLRGSNTCPLSMYFDFIGGGTPAANYVSSQSFVLLYESIPAANPH